MFERFTERARRVLVLAMEEARLLNHSFIGTEHLLLGLIHEGDGLAAQALRALGISHEAVREKIEETIGMGGTSSGSPPFTPRTKKVLELSLREALQLGHSYIGTEHLLLGLVREGEGVATTVLVSLGADLDSVRRATIDLMDRGRDPRGLGSHQSLASGLGWAPPAWDRPSEGTVPAVLAVDALVLHNDVVAVALEHLEVFSNGFTICVVTRVNPHKVREMMELLRPVDLSRWPHVGVRFADGRTARRGRGMDFGPDLQKDERGVPSEPIVSTEGVGTGSFGWRTRAWVFPLPPEGPLEILIALDAAGLSESSVTVDGSAIRAAAERTTVIWT